MSITIKQANQAFKKGDYTKALELYQQLSHTMDVSLFNINIQLCQKRLSNSPQPVSKSLSTIPSSQATSDIGVTKQNSTTQLIQTQALLEHYFTKAQQLEYQLLDLSK
jgi:hypothetical protein